MKNNPNYSNFIIRGLGVDQKSAAKDFMDQFHKQFPKMRGLYDLMLRSPLTYDVDLDGNHTYIIRGSTALISKLPEVVND